MSTIPQEKGKNETGARVGRVLSWEDRANPYRRGVVVGMSSKTMEVNFKLRRLLPARRELAVVLQDMTLLSISETLIDGNSWRWEQEPDLSAAACAELKECAEDKRARENEERERKAREYAEARKAFNARLDGLRPPWAKAVLVAIEDVDDCDLITDYHNHTEGRRILLAWSKHKRDLFSEMRKAARKCEHTKHLATAGKKAEHREKHSMGEGYYLKDGYGHGSGWRVEKVDLDFSIESLCGADLALVEKQ